MPQPGEDGRIDRLRRADMANLWAEGPGMPSQIALVGEFDARPFLDPDGGLDTGRIRHELARRARRVPALTRRVLWTRHGEGPPAWVPDADPDPSYDITCGRLPEGDDLVRWCADRVVRPLDRTRPLWRAEIVEGLPGSRFGLVLVVHHALADGLAGVAIAAALLDPAPDTAPPDPAAVPPPSPPTHRALVADHARTLGTTLAVAARGLPHLPGALRRAARQARDAAGDLRSTAPPTSLPRRVGPGRRLAAAEFDLDDLRAAAHAHGATVNDLLLAAVTVGLRDLLQSRGDDVTGLVLRASFPVGELPGQQAGMLLVGLPVGEPDPLRRLALISTATARMKARLRTGGGDVFDVLRLPGPLARLTVRWMLRAARRHINLFVTDVPGPARPLWLAGAPLLRAVPVAPLTADVPIGIAALSYAGTLSVSANVDSRVTDVEVLVRGIERDVADLIRRTGSA